MDIEPPEVPLLYSQLEQKEEKTIEPKKGFFAKLFSRVKAVSENEKKNATILQDAQKTKLDSKDEMQIPPLDIPTLPERTSMDSDTPFKNADTDAEIQSLEASLPPLPEMPNSSEENISPNIFIAGNDQKKKIKKYSKQVEQKTPKKTLIKFSEKTISRTNNFDWTTPISSQESIIKDSNRNNPDTNVLIEGADRYIEDTKGIMAKNNLSEIIYRDPDELNALPKIDEAPQMQEMPLMSEIHPVEKRSFSMLDKEHKKLRMQLNKTLKKNFNASDIRQLVKQYDLRIEKKLEQKAIELSNHRHKVESFQKLLKKKEQELLNLKKYLEKTDKTLKDKESEISQIISKEVEKRVTNISKKDKTILKREILNTISLNKKLKRQVDIIEKDRIDFDKKKEKLLEEERKILTASQAMYEKKLSELEKEKHELESKKHESLALLHKAGAISKELSELKALKQSISDDRRVIDELMIEDKQMREAVRIAEDNLKKERQELDKAVFSKYIQWKLGEAKLEDMQKSTIIKADPIDQTHKVYDVIEECKQLLARKDIKEAKRIYNTAKELYENTSFNPMEKVLVYNKLRALYSDIQLTSLDVDILV